MVCLGLGRVRVRFMVRVRVGLQSLKPKVKRGGLE